MVFSTNDQAGQETVIRKGLPTTSAEAETSLLQGKKLRQAKITMAREDELWVFTLDADTFAIRSMSLPAIDDPLDPMSYFQERIKNLYVFHRAFVQIFQNFLEMVTNENMKEKTTSSIQEWAKNLSSNQE